MTSILVLLFKEVRLVMEMCKNQSLIKCFYQHCCFVILLTIPVYLVLCGYLNLT